MTFTVLVERPIDHVIIITADQRVPVDATHDELEHLADLARLQKSERSPCELFRLLLATKS